MKSKLMLIGALAGVAALPVSAADSAPSRDKATGGGQTFFESDGAGSGAGDTVAFTAQRAKNAPDGSTDATGQIQVNRRGENAIKFHGTITCLVVEGAQSMGAAYMSGTSRNGIPFELYVTDGGKGQSERNDLINLWAGPETDQGDPGPSGDEGPCGTPDEPSGVALARGNVQTWNNNTSEDPDRSFKLPALLRSALR